ncbi:hypothetical protein TNCV_1172371 [Trichonephila clavipes]|uniref:Uncharacterized protein n=1 Tax=Trichonephila clavipes TaxID=2585209 RepID=A0A8X6V3H0_TRICX|nr:hypothetical protein TNCV_1172371 [Trichonephila clavipes]
MHVKSFESSNVYRWCGVVVERGVPAQVSSSSLDHGSKLRGPSPKSPRVAEQRDVNIHPLQESYCTLTLFLNALVAVVA